MHVPNPQRWRAILKRSGVSLGSVLLLLGLAYGAMRVNDGPVEFWPWFTISIGGAEFDPNRPVLLWQF